MQPWHAQGCVRMLSRTAALSTHAYTACAVRLHSPCLLSWLNPSSSSMDTRLLDVMAGVGRRWQSSTHDGTGAGALAAPHHACFPVHTSPTVSAFLLPRPTSWLGIVGCAESARSTTHA